MDPKPRPNHDLYIAALRRMTPEQRLLKAFELNEWSRTLFLTGLRIRFPHLSGVELDRLAARRIAECSRRSS